MTTLPIAPARAQLAQLIEAASSTHARVESTKNGNRAAVLLGADYYDSMVETIAVLSDAALFGDHRKGLEDVAAGVVLDKKRLTEMLNTARRQLDGG